MSNRIVVFMVGIAVGVAGFALLGGTAGFAQRKPEPPAKPPIVKVDESKVQVAYANGYRIHTTAEECVIDFGFNMPNPNDPARSDELLFAVSHIILNYPNTKRLTTSLDTLVKRYEQQFGEKAAPGADGKKAPQP